MADIDIEKIVQSVVSTIAAKGLTGGAKVDLSPDTTTREKTVNQKPDVKWVAIGACPATGEVKEVVKTFLESVGFNLKDVSGEGEADSAGVAAAVARKVTAGDCDRGIVFTKDGLGAAIVCNKIKGIRAAACYDMRSTINSREFYNANVMTLGGLLHGESELCEMAKAWLEASSPNGDNWAAVNRIMSFERS